MSATTLLAVSNKIQMRRAVDPIEKEMPSDAPRDRFASVRMDRSFRNPRFIHLRQQSGGIGPCWRWAFKRRLV